MLYNVVVKHGDFLVEETSYLVDAKDQAEAMTKVIRERPLFNDAEEYRLSATIASVIV